MSKSKSLPNSVSRRDFLRYSVLTAGAALAARGLTLRSFAQDTTELSIVIPGRDLEVQYFTAIVDSFNAQMQTEGKSVHATLAPGPATDNDFKTKITLDAASGTAGDVTWINGGLYQDFAAAGYLADLTPLLSSYADWDKFASVIKQQLTLNDKTYGLSDASTFTLFYRKDLLQENGISTDQPATWDDFYAICDSIKTKTDATPAGIPAARPWGGGSWGEGFKYVWMGFAQSNEIYDPADSKWVVKSDSLLKALQVYDTLAKNGWLTVQELLSPNPWTPIKYEEFPQKKVAVVTGGDWQWQYDWGPEGATPIDGLFEKVDRWLFPSSVGDPFTYAGAGRILSIASTSPNMDAAFEFITWAFSPQGTCDAFQVLFNGPSARSDMAANCPYYTTGVEGKMAQAGATLDSGRFLVTGPGENMIGDGIALATEDVITAAKTPEEAMDAFAASVTELIGADGVKQL